MNNNLILASTVLVLRDLNNKLELLMVRRSKKPPFQNLHVFPGGKIDHDDSIKELEAFTDGINDEIASNILGIEDGGLSFWIASIRECFEEVGILLAQKKSGEKLDFISSEKTKYENYRKMLVKNEINLLEICQKEDLVLSTVNIAPLSHWITPNIETKRFDTRFFIAYLPENQIVKHDEVELTQSIWINPLDAIKKAYEGEMHMIMPTIKNLEQCSKHKNGEEFLRHQKSLSHKDFPPILPKFFKKNDKWTSLLPGDPDYEKY